MKMSSNSTKLTTLNMHTSCAFTPPIAVCRTIRCRNLAVAYPTRLLPCSIALPIDVLALPNM